MLRLGLQSTSLTNESAFVLSSVLKANSLIQVSGSCSAILIYIRYVV